MRLLSNSPLITVIDQVVPVSGFVKDMCRKFVLSLAATLKTLCKPCTQSLARGITTLGFLTLTLGQAWQGFFRILWFIGFRVSHVERFGDSAIFCLPPGQEVEEPGKSDLLREARPHKNADHDHALSTYSARESLLVSLPESETTFISSSSE